MPPRLTDIYRPGDAVDVLLGGEIGEEWRPGQVLALQHPGVWVRTAKGQLWFVTNGRRIRPHAGSAEEPTAVGSS
jgi:hypothetical protein